MTDETADWAEIAAGKIFISDTGADVRTTKGGVTLTLGRYAVWAPRATGAAEGHSVVEVSSDLSALMAKYNVPKEHVLAVTQRGAN